MPPPPSQAVWRDDGALVAVNPPDGGPTTGFFLHGSGWQPGQRLTVSIVGGRTVPNAIVADDGGGFDYVLNAGHDFFPGDIPPGTYHVQVRSGSVVAAVTFSVRPATDPSASPNP